MEIEIGEYVRTNRGLIGKIYDEDGIDKNGIYTDTEYINEYLDKTVYTPNKDVVKHSKKIIDLIEVGDYINLERVLDITEEYIRTTERIHNKCWLSNNIRSIVTKEQFENAEYRITEENRR